MRGRSTPGLRRVVHIWLLVADIVVVVALLQIFNDHEAIVHYTETFFQILPTRQAAVDLGHDGRVNFPEPLVLQHHLLEVKSVALLCWREGFALVHRGLVAQRIV